MILLHQFLNHRPQPQIGHEMKMNLDKIEYDNWIAISLSQIFKMQFGCLVRRVVPLYCIQSKQASSFNTLIIHLIIVCCLATKKLV